ncbi:MAG TPA: GAF and ANTAR domain-containing protein [Humibacillus xanthopallidus]|nr:GAF and ANTAR domain-containing protein [Humibacillus xanthopallidus]
MTDRPPTEEGTSEKTPSRDALLARRFVSLADTLVADYDVVDLLDELAHTCVEFLGVTAAGLLLTDQRGALQLVAYSEERTHLLELFQLQNDEGPCLDCMRTGRAVIEPDLAAAGDRWPKFAVAATEAGFRSVIALPLRLRDQVIGGLNLFDTRETHLDDDERAIAQALADVATIGILQQRSRHRASLLAEQLQKALNTRIVIEQAKGVIAECGRMDMETAFETLRAHARNTGQLLSTVAEDLAGGRLDPAEVLAARTPRT